jgi:hypothetical protein
MLEPVPRGEGGRGKRGRRVKGRKGWEKAKVAKEEEEGKKERPPVLDALDNSFQLHAEFER